MVLEHPLHLVLEVWVIGNEEPIFKIVHDVPFPQRLKNYEDIKPKINMLFRDRCSIGPLALGLWRNVMLVMIRSDCCKMAVVNLKHVFVFRVVRLMTQVNPRTLI